MAHGGSLEYEEDFLFSLYANIYQMIVLFLESAKRLGEIGMIW